jgi:hypothetical protein
MPEEPKWYYKLDEVVYQGYRNNMHVPILTLWLLKQESRESFFYVPELEIRQDPNSERPDFEVDFCCVIDGSVAIGEATVSTRLGKTATEEAERLSQHRDVAARIGSAWFILSTLAEEWSTETRRIANDAFIGSEVAVKFYVRGNLVGQQEPDNEVSTSTNHC